jgi:hypothetical protein
MSGELKILTFCWHESYLRSLVRTEHRWDVVPRSPAFTEQPWVLARALPPNARVVSWPRGRTQLARGAYDLVVTHAMQDLVDATASRTPVVAVVHEHPAVHQALGTPRAVVDSIVRRAAPAAVVYVSDEKRGAWGWPGEVIAPGFDADEAPPFEGDQAGVLVVSNLLQEAPEVTGYRWLDRIAAGLPLHLYGVNPSVPESGRPIPDLLAVARQHLRVFLDMANPDVHVGPTSAMLDAMAAGMPVVTRSGAGRPIVDGVNGFASADAGRLRLALLELLEDATRAQALGAAARQTIRERYPLAGFLAAWRGLLASVSAGDRAQDAASALRLASSA